MSDIIIAIKKEQNKATLKLAGELRFMSALSLDQALRSIPTNWTLYFDFEDLFFMDSTILGTLIKFLMERNQQVSSKDKIFLLSGNVNIKKMLKKVGFENFVKELPSSETAENKGEVTYFEPISREKPKLEKAILEAHQILNKLDPKGKHQEVISVIQSHRQS